MKKILGDQSTVCECRGLGATAHLGCAAWAQEICQVSLNTVLKIQKDHNVVVHLIA
jgi:hypothetical protein